MTETHTPCVSVVIPTYNRCALLQRAVGSVLDQTEKNIEIIIADDGSGDETPAVFETPADPRIRYLRLPHQGACAARNAGIEAARGQYIAFLDSDDTWRPEKLALQKKQLESSGADIIFCAFLRHEADGKTVTRYPLADVPEGPLDYRSLLASNLVSTQTLFGRADCIKQLRFDERFPRMQDWEFALQTAKRFRLVYFADALADMYLQGDSISTHPERGLAAVRLLYDKYREDYTASAKDTHAIMIAVHHYAVQCGEYCGREYFRMAAGGDFGWRKAVLLFHAARFAAREMLPMPGKQKEK